MKKKKTWPCTDGSRSAQYFLQYQSIKWFLKALKCHSFTLIQWRNSFNPNYLLIDQYYQCFLLCWIETRPMMTVFVVVDTTRHVYGNCNHDHWIMNNSHSSLPIVFNCSWCIFLVVLLAMTESKNLDFSWIIILEKPDNLSYNPW